MALTPQIVFSPYYNDALSERRGLGLAMGLELLKRCDEMWVCGDTLSQVMKGEIDLARQLKIPTFYVSETQLISDIPIRQMSHPLSYGDITGDRLDIDLKDKILVYAKAETIDDSLWKLSPVAEGYDDLLNVINLVTGEEADIWRTEFAGIVNPKSLYWWRLDNPIHDELVYKTVGYNETARQHFRVLNSMNGNIGNGERNDLADFYYVGAGYDDGELEL